MPSQNDSPQDNRERDLACREIYAALRGQFKGDLLRPSNQGYEEARTIWNGMFAPFHIVRASS
jgi:hypothetical protein